jgi:hypothetical protein
MGRIMKNNQIYSRVIPMMVKGRKLYMPYEKGSI